MKDNSIHMLNELNKWLQSDESIDYLAEMDLYDQQFSQFKGQIKNLMKKSSELIKKNRSSVRLLSETLSDYIKDSEVSSKSTRHTGDIAFESITGKSTTFKFNLPFNLQ